MKNSALILICLVWIQTKLEAQELVDDGNFARQGNPDWSAGSDYPREIANAYHRPRTIIWKQDRAVRANPGQCCSIEDLTPVAKGVNLQQWLSTNLYAGVPYTVNIGTWQISNISSVSRPISDSLIVSFGDQEIARLSEFTTLAPYSNIPHSLTATFAPEITSNGPLKLRMERWDLVSSSVHHTLDDVSITPVWPCTQRLPLWSNAKNLVFVTHGWLGDMGWVNDLKGKLDTLIHKTQTTPQDWQVIAYDWTAQANTAFPTTALDNAVVEGTCVGKLLANRGYTSVHAIAHSAGSGLIQVLSEELAEHSPETFTHLTFLDAYAPGDWPERYGQQADFSDHYFNRGDSLGTDLTEAQLSWAYNVDVTALDSTPTPSSPSQGHAWPHEWYRASATTPTPGSREFGAPLSRAAGITSDFSQLYPRDSLITLALPPSGDANEDMESNQEDLRVIAEHFGSQNAAWQNGDLSGDGSVSLQDIIMWRNTWFPPAPSAPIPEPSSLALFGLGSIMLLVRRRK